MSTAATTASRRQLAACRALTHLLRRGIESDLPPITWTVIPYRNALQGTATTAAAFEAWVKLLDLFVSRDSHDPNAWTIDFTGIRFPTGDDDPEIEVKATVAAIGADTQRLLALAARHHDS